ncbi:MAG TPA: hypothetical protein VK706_00930, partial [Candidatus Sulfotelmatobacter sp.]|nr:hypothetical protein [Candidatus Sulfotelmatobacter sp.]
CPVAPLTDVDRILKAVQSEHERFSAYQLSVGGYQPLPGEDSYTFSDTKSTGAVFATISILWPRAFPRSVFSP